MTPSQDDVAKVREALNEGAMCLIDYIQQLEAKGSSLYYGRSIVKKIIEARSILERLNTAPEMEGESG